MQPKVFPFGHIIEDGELKKIPLVNDWASQASNDPKVIQHWRDTFRDHIKGWGMPTGAVNGIYALDIDVKDGRNGFEYLRSQGIELPDIAYQNTPSGGRHIFFKHNPEFSKTTVNRVTGIDTRGDGGFVWLYNPDFSKPIPPIPDWVPQIVKRHYDYTHPEGPLVELNPAKAERDYQMALDKLRAAAVGERNHTLNLCAFTIGQLVAGGGIDANRAQADLAYVAESIGLSPHEIQATIRSGIGGGHRHPITHPFGSTPPPLPPGASETPILPPGDARWTPRFTTVADLKNWRKLKKPQLFKDWSSEDIILTSAIGGVGKTTIKLFEAVCLAVGAPFLGFECVTPGRTLFIAGEDSKAKLEAMLGRICQQLGFFDAGQEHFLESVINNVVIKRADDICLVAMDPRTRTFIPNQVALDKIYQAIEDLRPKQIVLDPIAMFWGPESALNDMVLAVHRTLQKIQAISDASIDMIAHIGKDSHTKKDTGQYSARGGTALASHSRIVRTLLKLNGEEYLALTGESLADNETAIECVVSKFSDGSPLLDKPFIIIRKGYLFERKDIPDHVSRGGDSDSDKLRILNFIKASTEDRPISSDIVTNHFFLEDPKINKSTCRALIKKLEYEGVIEEVPHQDALVGNWLRVKS